MEKRDGSYSRVPGAGALSPCVKPHCACDERPKGSWRARTRRSRSWLARVGMRAAAILLLCRTHTGERHARGDQPGAYPRSARVVEVFQGGRTCICAVLKCAPTTLGQIRCSVNMKPSRRQLRHDTAMKTGAGGSTYCSQPEQLPDRFPVYPSLTYFQNNIDNDNHLCDFIALLGVSLLEKDIQFELQAFFAAICGRYQC